MTEESFFGRRDFTRGRYGWALVHPENGGKPQEYKRATTIAGYLDDKGGLIDWTAAKVAEGVARAKNLQAVFATHTWEEDKGKIKEAIEQAKAAGGASTAADLGTTFHRVIETELGGREFDYDLLPTGYEWEAASKAFHALIKSLGFTVVASELQIVDDKHKVAGTADLVLRADREIETPHGAIPAGAIIIADNKTGSVADYSGLKMGIQLGIYSHGTPYDANREARTPWPGGAEVTQIGLIIKIDLKLGTATPWWLDLEAAYKLVPLAVKADKARYEGKKLIKQGVPVAPVEMDGEPAPAAEAPQVPAKVAEPEAEEEVLSQDPTDYDEDVEPEKAKAAADLGAEIRDALGKAETVEELREVWKTYAKHLTDAQKKAIKTRVAKLEEEEAAKVAEPVKTAAEADPEWPADDELPAELLDDAPAAEPTLDEKLEQITDLNELQAFWKENSKGLTAEEKSKITARAAKIKKGEV